MNPLDKQGRNKHDKSQGEHEPLLPVCSVLNTVVDFVMRPPSPLEDIEYQQEIQVEVPILRIFGPILRRDTTRELAVLPHPVQSACLYIHNAFPYLLARPVSAGPDGSNLHATGGHINWDSVDHIQRVAPVLMESLEAAIQASFQEFGGESTEKQDNATSRKRMPVIRRVTVVEGRGFYSYCPGPSAPFLRVEYYNPALRWKVKRELERGLEGLPTFYYPDNAQYDCLTQMDPSLPIQFHCYEAHIPYTMQFFKDYNLSGMSYIHLSDKSGEQVNILKFRDPLPKWLHPKQQVNDESLLFLESNTPDSYRWQGSTIVIDKVNNQLSQNENPILIQKTSQAVPLPAHCFAAKKETSCALEVDVTADCILNVFSVMTDLEEEEKETVHWRAVPSLREIWQEEKRRMAKMIPPSEDFLSQGFTLNVKRGADKPGARLAVKGMRDLVEVTDGLYESFQRVLKEIVERHSGAIQKMDDYIRQGPAVTSHSENELFTSFTPSNDDALEDLGALRELFEDPSLRSPPTATCTQGRLSFEILPTKHSQTSRQLSQSDQRFKDLSQSYYDLRQSQIDEYASTEFELSQRVERGEGIAVNGLYEELDDFINPQTLMPYDDTGEDEDEEDLGDDEMNANQMEKELSVLATQSFLQLDDTSRSRSFSPLQEAKLMQLDSQSLWEDSKDLKDGSDEPSSKNVQEKSAAIYYNLDVVAIPRKMSLRSRPPTREEVLSGGKATGLYAMHAGNITPEWMRHLHLFNKRKESTYKSNFFERDEKCRFQLVHQPPDRDAMQRWHRARQEKLPMKERDMQQAPKKEVPTGLPLDENSRKRFSAHSVNISVEEAEVEKADWVEDLDQQSTLNNVELTQQGQVHPLQPPTKSAIYDDTPLSGSPTHDGALQGIGNQGGRLWIEGGGELKTKTRPSQVNASNITQTTSSLPYLPSPVTLMVLEVHVQCRTGRAGVSDSKTISMTPDSARDKVSAVVYVFGKDPGGGEAVETIERGCIFVPVGKELELAMTRKDIQPFEYLAASVRKSMPRQVLGVAAPLSIESVRDERQLLLRIASIIRYKDPDMLLSWDTQGLGTGYLIERGIALGKDKQISAGNTTELDLARLFGRTPASSAISRGKNPKVEIPQFKSEVKNEIADSETPIRNYSRWQGSGLGVEWDDKVGAGAAAASVVGRISFAVWKIVAEEVKHPNSSYQPAVVSSVLNKRIPCHDNLKLSEWYGHDNGKERWRVLHYRLVQATCSLLLFDALDMIGRSGEAARLSGVEFSQSFPGIRGSQYKVEGVLLRALRSLNANERGSKKGQRLKPPSSVSTPFSLSSDAKSQSQSPWKARRREREMESDNLSNRSYFFYSPSLTDSDKQEALEVQALTLEPQSGHHRDPIVVCDFTALYPSLIIAYNLCYSTCAGRLDYHSTRSEMRIQGKTKGRLGPFHYSEQRSASIVKHHIRSLDNEISDRAYVSPTGTIFVSEEVLKGVLPQVLDEMLSTRAMLKKAAKVYKKSVPDLSPSILRQLEARQLALKYVANVTYGYTSATFSGRCAMPLLADTIVECARRTLNNAINLANRWGRDSSGKWFGCEVLYGDTDSVFVKLPGRSVQEGFQFGEEFCGAVTASNPPPVQLKLEKVYWGCILQTKKKYCGMKFESKDQTKPFFEAKGIETIRRDQCPLTQKVLRNSLITLFQHDALAVKEYLFRQWNLILAGQLPVSDFVLTGRVRSKYRGGRVGPVQAVLARRLSEGDPGRIIRHKERVSYVIVATPGKAFRLRDCVLTPMELLEQWDAYTIHAGYYITKHLNAALQRCLSLAPHHINVLSWYETCPKPRRRIHFWPITKSGNSIMISSYFGSDICFLCHSKCTSQGTSRTAICKHCREDPVNATLQTVSRLNDVQEISFRVAKMCSACNLCGEDASTFAQNSVPSSSKNRKALQTGVITPLANCSCIDCPVTYERHRLREAEIEATAACEALGMD